MKEAKNFLKLWGFHEKDLLNPLSKLNLTDPVLRHLESYIVNFPASEGLAFVGHPKIVARTMARVVKDIYDRGSIHNRVTVIDVPSMLLQFTSSTFEARAESETELLGNLDNSDLVVFQEIALTKWNDIQRARLYIMLQRRYSKGLPFFCTVGCDEETFGDYVGQSNFFRISDHCMFIELKYAND